MSSIFSIKTMWRSFLCALTATVTLSVCSQYYERLLYGKTLTP